MTLPRTWRRVAVDLTALEPGGANGGAGVVATSLVREMSALAPDAEFVLLTASRSHGELATLDGPNVRRECVLPQPDAARPGGAALVRARHDVRDRLRRLIGPRRLARLRSLYWSVRYRRPRARLLRRLGAEVYFCPLTTAFCTDPSVPRISVIHDLQHVRFPAFFSVEQRIFRQQQLEDALRHSMRTVCVSDHVRESVLEALPIDPARVVTVHLPVLQPIGNPGTLALRQLGLEPDGFLLYPSNFWQHKNHARLLQAFAEYRRKQPDSPLRLVCSGLLDARGQALRDCAASEGLADWVLFSGYLPATDLAALLQTCRAVIYPSLYEGFGMPILEAMACGKPVLCSRAGSLPEVAGDAAVFFDAENVASIAEAIAWVDSASVERDALAARGRARAASFGTPRQMAERYLALFSEAVAEAAPC